MVESPEVREQYHRVLERFHQAKQSHFGHDSAFEAD
ncbi:unnamed protein product, partial [Vitis vinifera]|uniref:Uncharacterized protein n=1 Tax=Vitis vinifera TaxID=29760 RepID=D7TAZ9_VITVI